LLQGGFYPQAFLLLGICFSIGAIICFKKRRFRYELVLFGGFCSLYILSSVVNYFSIETLTYAMLPTVCLVFWILQKNTKKEHKEKLAQNLAIFTIIVSIVSILSLIGVFNISGNSTANRLQFTFQYANAAGIYFAAIALMIRGINNKKLERFIPIIQIALFLTQSIGAITLYFVGIVIAVFIIPEVNRIKLSIYNLSKVSISAAFALAIYFSIFKLQLIALSLIVLVLALIYSFYHDQINNIFEKLKINHILFALLCAIAVYLIFSQRVYQGSQTFLERLVQISDGASAIKDNPILGVGPGNWQYMHDVWKTAQYDAQIIHSSFIQIGVDVGIPALIVLVILASYSIIRVKINSFLKAAAIIILLHSILDFSLYFLSIDLLLIFILTYGSTDTETKVTNRKVTKLIWVLILFVLCTCFTGSMITARAKQYALEGRLDKAIAVLEKSAPLFTNSYNYKYNYSSYLQGNGDYERAMNVANTFPYSSQIGKLLKAKIFDEQGESAKALGIVFARIEEAPFDIAAYEYARRLITKIPEYERENYKQQYNKYVQKLNNSTSYLARKLKNQKLIEIYN
jgi:hypothetical protein